MVQSVTGHSVRRYPLRAAAWRALLVLALALPATGPLAAQEEAPKNLKVLPKDMSRAQVVAVMRGFTGALGVRCSTCHVGEEGKPLSTYDFASDDKPMKLKAREMLKMVSAINGDYLAQLPERRQPNVSVTCNTCHRGVSRPEPIEQIVQTTMESDDVDTAIQKYRTLREKYYGSAAYDFSDRPLVSLAEGLAKDNPDAATKLLMLNAEYNPTSAATFAAMGAIAEQIGDTVKAIENYKKALAIQPGNRRVEARLKALGGGNR